jgi:hypothetical protein
MFNEILTGKASLEAKPPAVDPYREESIPAEITLTCLRCSKEYTAKGGTAAGNCGACNAVIAQENAAASAAAFREAENRFNKNEASHAVMKTLLVIGFLVVIAFIRHQMRKAQRDDAAQAAGYSDYNDYKTESAKVYPTDEFSHRVNSFASDMCYCQDLACGRNVYAQYSRYVKSNAPSDDKASESAQQDAQKLGDCMATLEAGGTPARTW